MKTLLQNAKNKHIKPTKACKENLFSTDTHISIGLAKSFKHKITFKDIYLTKRNGLSLDCDLNTSYNVP